MCADSGFATPELYELCEERRNFYVIRLKSNHILGKIAEQFIPIDDQHDWDRKMPCEFRVLLKLPLTLNKQDGFT